MTIDRRSALRLIGALPVAVGFTFERGEALAAAAKAEKVVKAAAAGKAYQPKFFNPDEWQLVRVLVDKIIPKDERSGGATDAGVPEFMDFIMNDPTDTDLQRERRQTAMRGGLAWLDRECTSRYDKMFVNCTDAERTKVLDEIAWPSKAAPGISHGVAFFNMFRDLTASGFWTSKMGITDLKYIGNTVVPEWKGCPDEVLKKLGVQRG